MLFTVVQYLPLIEEDYSGCKTELSKKENDASSDDTSDDDSSESDETDAVFEDLNYVFFQNPARFYSAYNCKTYISALLLKTTPPPKA